jgi:hypothetical protein
MMRLILATCLLIIVSVSAVDAYLNMKYPVCVATEENPVARYILHLSSNDIALLISLKLFGTVTAVALLMAYYSIRKMAATVVAVVLAITQLLLMAYMVI